MQILQSAVNTYTSHAHVCCFELTKAHVQHVGYRISGIFHRSSLSCMTEIIHWFIFRGSGPNSARLVRSTFRVMPQAAANAVAEFTTPPMFRSVRR